MLDIVLYTSLIYQINKVASRRRVAISVHHKKKNGKYTSLIHQINKVALRRRVAISVRHKKKNEKFGERQHKYEWANAETKIDKYILQLTFSTYSVSNEQYIALPYSLNTHIPSKSNANIICISSWWNMSSNINSS